MFLYQISVGLSMTAQKSDIFLSSAYKLHCPRTNFFVMARMIHDFLQKLLSLIQIHFAISSNFVKSKASLEASYIRAELYQSLKRCLATERKLNNKVKLFQTLSLHDENKMKLSLEVFLCKAVSYIELI